VDTIFMGGGTPSIMTPAQLQAQGILTVGAKGEDVKKLQQRLKDLGYLSGKVDGAFGGGTKRAVIAFQRRNGLAADGRVGPATAKAMGVSLSGSGAVAASASIISADHRLLSRLVYAEARGETYKGQVAVAAVVLNRVASASFPNTISGVIFQSGAFSCVSNGSINNTPDSTAVRAALDALNGWDPTGGCLYYYNPRATNDQWIRTRTVKTVIGNHQFAV
jgi:N-acetylmuramoyl-L-alanine amidase